MTIDCVKRTLYRLDIEHKEYRGGTRVKTLPKQEVIRLTQQYRNYIIGTELDIKYSL